MLRRVGVRRSLGLVDPSSSGLSLEFVERIPAGAAFIDLDDAALCTGNSKKLR
jgi:hypothetical protein